MKVKLKQKNSKEKRTVYTVFYLFLALLVLTVGYLCYFLLFESYTVVNNTFNKRGEKLAAIVQRGSILTNDGTVVAETVVNEDKSETRVYPYGRMFSHVVGRMEKGLSGIEASQNIVLLTSNSNPLTKLLNNFVNQKNLGDNVVTTLDFKLQKTAYEALGEHKGVIVVMEPSTGRILALVSKPDYDPNSILSDWESLNENENAPLLNRATLGLYPPGSTFKTLTALAYFRQFGTTSGYEYDCNGEFTYQDMTIHCYNNRIHGQEDLFASYYNSCNSSFAQIATVLDRDFLKRVCNDFLFNQNISNNDMGINKSKFSLSTSSDMFTMLQIAIGQGQTQITPMQNALIAAAIANQGVMQAPYVIDRVEKSNGEVIKQYAPIKLATPVTKEEAALLGEMMRGTVTNGTGSKLITCSVSVAGKTGSADHKEGEKAHAWFVGFAPYESPKIVVSIVVESVGTGSEFAVPIAKKIFEAYFE